MPRDESVYRYYPFDLRPWLHLDHRVLAILNMPNGTLAGKLGTVTGCDRMVLDQGLYPLHMVVALDAEPDHQQTRAYPFSLLGLN